MSDVKFVLPLEEVRSWYYIKSWGMTVFKNKWDLYIDFVPRLYKTKENEKNEISFFCDVYYPILPEGMSDEFNNYLIRLYLTEYNKFVEIPVSMIKKTWRAGWPREGIMALRYTDFPWRLLKPIKAFIDNPVDIDLLKESLYKDKVRYKNVGIDIYYNHIFPWINNDFTKAYRDIDMKTWILGLETLYEMAISMSKQVMFKAFSISKQGYPYVGISVDTNEYQKLVNEDNENPFIQYLSVCIKKQIEILKK
ncbi:MAG: hypothetical protein K8Q99_06825 [Acholeplasmataceae bacterium]|nr:hypothetical protein [Acholeplasmataceae bacterium]